jgi:hypothetical protein
MLTDAPGKRLYVRVAKIDRPVNPVILWRWTDAAQQHQLDFALNSTMTQF